MFEANEIFEGTGVVVDTEGARHLGAPLQASAVDAAGAVGPSSFKESYIKTKIDGWIESVGVLAGIARTQPHAAFAGFIHCLQGRWNFTARTLKDGSNLFYAH